MFEKFNFSKEQIEKFLKSAERDLSIARSDKAPEAIFLFSYNALIKISIVICARNGFRVKSQQGHHRELLEKLAEFLKDEEIELIGNEMRMKRNWDFYDGGIVISEKEAKGYREWVQNVLNKAL